MVSLAISDSPFVVASSSRIGALCSYTGYCAQRGGAALEPYPDAVGATRVRGGVTAGCATVILHEDHRRAQRRIALTITSGAGRVNDLFVLLGIQSWKPLLTALVLPPVPWLLLMLIGARMM